MNTTDSTKHVSLADTRDPSPLEMDAETFYHLGMLAVEIATEYLEGIPPEPSGKYRFCISQVPNPFTQPREVVAA